MPSNVPQVVHSPSILEHPILFPVKIILSPLIAIAYVIKRFIQTVFGYLIKLGVFPFGSMNKSWFKRKIIEIYQGGCYDTHDRALFNPGRLIQAFKVLEDVGGVRTPTFSKDGTKLDTMLLRYQDVKEKIERQGGKFACCLPISITKTTVEGRIKTTHCMQTNDARTFVDVIIPDETRNIHDWDNFCRDVLSPCYLERAIISLKNGRTVPGYILKYWESNQPIRPKENQLFIRCNAPTESYATAKRDILRHVLSLRSDVLCFDYPGTWKSDGTPTEGTYYLAAETMVDKAVNEYGYAFEDIWATGFCLGGAVAAHLKRKYHEFGINLATQNTFNRIYDTLRMQVWPASILAPYAICELQSKNPEVIRLTQQDCFDTIQKFERLPPLTNPKGGISIIINTDSDTTVHKNSHKEIVTAVSRVSNKTFSQMFHHPDQRKNGHSYDVLGETDVWNNFTNYVTYKDHPEVLDPVKSNSELLSDNFKRYWTWIKASLVQST